jgi:hypothetical protein
VQFETIVEILSIAEPTTTQNNVKDLFREASWFMISRMRIVVGIPSFQEADSIAFVTARADEGLARFGPSVDCVIVNADGNSPDGTAQVFLSTPHSLAEIIDHDGRSPRQRAVTCALCSSTATLTMLTRLHSSTLMFVA